MTDAALQVKVGMSGVHEASDGLDRLSDSSKRAEDSTKSLERGSKKSSTAVTGQGAAASRAANHNRRLATSVEGSSRAMERMAVIAGRLIGILAVTFSTRAILDLGDSWERMTNQVGAATRDMENAGVAMERLLQISRASYSPMQQTVQTFTDAVPVFRNMGKSAQQAADYVESLNLMLVAGYVEGQRAESVQWALNKAMAVGKLTTQGLETVLANSAEVSQALADELGVTTNELRKMASEGKITGDVISRAIIDRLEQTRDVVAKMPYTMGGAMQTMRTEMLDFARRVNQAASATSTLAQGIVIIAHNIDRIASYIGAAGIAMGAYAIATNGAAIATGLLNAALIAQRAALAATGWGAFVIILGEVILLIWDTVQAADGAKDAFIRLANVGITMLKSIGSTAYGLVEIMAGVASLIAGSFLRAFAVIGKAWDTMVNGMVTAWNFISEKTGGIMGTLEKSNVGGALQGGAEGLFNMGLITIRSGGDRIVAAAKDVGEAVARATEESAERSVRAIRNIEEAYGPGGGGEGDGGEPGGVTGAAKRAAAAIKDSAKEVDEYMKTLKEQSERGANALATLFTDAITGANSLKQGIINLIAEIAKMQLMKGFTMLFGMGGPLGGFGLSLGGLFANGAAFSGGLPLTAYATGGVVDRPTVFPMARGAGLMGEAGPEAIMPLRRGPGGRLGVEGGGGRVDVRVFMDDNGNWQAEAARISGRVTTEVLKRRDNSRKDGQYLNRGGS